MNLGELIDQIHQQTANKYANTSWWGDYQQAASQGKDALWNWMHSIDTGERQYPDWSPDAAALASQQLAIAQEHTRNLFGVNVNQGLADRIGSASAKLGKAGMIVGGAIAGGAALGAGGAGAAGAEGGLAGEAGAGTLAGGAAADTLGAGAAGDAGVYGVSGIESAAAPGLTAEGAAGATGAGTLAGSAGGGGYLGSGLTAGTTASGIGGGELGTGLSAGGAATGATGAAGSSFLSGLGLSPGIMGALLGGALGGLGGGSRPAGTTTTVQDIPDWLKPYAIGNLNDASSARNGLINGPNVASAAIPGYIDTINGRYLDPSSNPYLDATYQHAAGLVGAGVDSRFEAAGRYGSGAHQGVLQEGLNNLATGIFGQNYQTERSRQMAAITGSPEFQTNQAAAAYAPYTGYASLFPNVKSTSQPYFTNPAANIAGGAIAGNYLGKAIG